MDADFEIFVPIASSLSGLPFEVPHYEWDGISYPQGPPECVFGSHFKLRVMSRYDFNFVESKLPKSLKSVVWQVVSVDGNGLDLFSSELFGLDKQEPGYTLLDLLTTFLSNEPIWAVVFSPESDGFANTYYGDVSKVISCLENSLRGNIEGFLVYYTRE